MKRILRQYLFPLRKDVLRVSFGPLGERALHLCCESRRWRDRQTLPHRWVCYSHQSPGSPAKRGERYPNAPKDGSILIIILWAIIILSILSLALGNFIFAQIKFTNSFVRSAGAAPLAKAACYAALYERRDDTTKNYDSEKELSEPKTQLFENEVSFKYHFEDEGSRININTVGKDVLLKLPGLDESLAEAVVNSKRRPFKIKEEVLLVEGITKEKFNQFKDIVTVYGNGKININVVSSEVLSVLGLEDELVNIIMRYRKESAGADGKTGTDDDGAFLSTSDILSGLRSFEMLSLRQEQQLLSAMSYLTVKSDYLRVKVSVKMTAKAESIFSAVIQPDQSKDKILAWSE